MANREELAIIRNARAGQVAAQLELGKLYLFGSAGLPQSLPTALHWLERAARQDCPPAWQLIGNHIPLELAQRNASAVAEWYERAYDDGSVHAGLVYAQLVLDPSPTSAQQHPKAVRALEDAARAGFPHAQWMLSQQQGKQSATAHGAQSSAQTAAHSAARTAPGVTASVAATPGLTISAATRGATPIPAHGVPRRPSVQGGSAALYALLNDTWADRQWALYLERALPQARALVGERAEQGEMRRFAPDEITLLSRCARLLDPALDGVSGLDAQATDVPASGALLVRPEPGEPGVFWELAAAENDRHAQLALGLRCARMRVDGRRISNGGAQANGQGANGQGVSAQAANVQVANAHVANAHVANAHVANFKKAIRWLTLAGEQGLAEAWYALSRIYIKPEFSQRNVADAQRYLERSAEMGYRDAQLECGHNAWRARRENESNDVRAVFWLQKAAAQGSPEAVELLRKIAPRTATAPYTETGQLLASHAEALSAHPLLGARVELAALFMLTRAEALLLDVGTADQGHCLVIDIRASYGRSKRRLVMVESAHEREALDRIVRLFEQVDCGPAGPEGNYRQRLYRLRTLLNVAAPGSNDDASPDIGLAA
jgi:TPR repeat protein